MSNISKFIINKVENKLKDRYSIKEYNVDTSDNLLAMPMDAVLSSIFFLWNLGIDLSKTILNYSELGVETNLTHQQILAENGDGISQYTHSLMGILQDLKISPN